MPRDKRMYLDRLAIVKSYGFNHVRHHSVIMPHEYYEACDEVGILSTAEFVLGYPQQLPGAGSLWKQNAPEGSDPKVAFDFLYDMFGTLVRQYRNHPSIAWWVGGNELMMVEGGWPVWRDMEMRFRFQKIVNELDPDRPFVDCDGDWLQQLRSGEVVRDTEDIYSVLFDEWTSPIANQAGKFKMEPLGKPALSHESGNYCTFMRPDQYEMFNRFVKKDGSVKRSDFIPFWMADGVKKLRELGYAAEADAWADASEKQYFLLHKYNVEGMRLNPAIVGYYWWLIQDYWTTSNGLVDYFFRPKPGIDPKEVARINAPVVALQQGLPRTARAGEKFAVKTYLSNFGGENNLAVAELC
ncbi:MAG: hypothetical protein HUK22_02825, partial [Thermoguttaceae bacterium]|nr:hypothetical protein [Thermoguttaceae bacterium]